MKLATCNRKHRYACPRFVTTSVVAEPTMPYGYTTPLDTPEKCEEFWHHVVEREPDHERDKESVVVALLNTRYYATGWNRVSLGTVSESSLHPREVLRPCVVGGAYAFILMHNHPSGDPSPSRADESATRRIVESSGLLKIRLLDHVVIGTPAPGRSGFYSFRAAGLIP